MSKTTDIDAQVALGVFNLTLNGLLTPVLLVLNPWLTAACVLWLHGKFLAGTSPGDSVWHLVAYTLLLALLLYPGRASQRVYTMQRIGQLAIRAGVANGEERTNANMTYWMRCAAITIMLPIGVGLHWCVLSLMTWFGLISIGVSV